MSECEFSIRLLPGLLPFVGLLLAAAVWASLRPQGSGRLRESVLVGTLACGVWIVAGCEILSLARAVMFWPVLLWWLIPVLALAYLVWNRRVHLRGLASLPDRPGWCTWMPIATAAGLMLLAGVVALLSPPNTYDALAYHMPRQVRWFQQASVEHLPVRDLHMVIMPPMAEFASLHMMVLSRSDLYATLVQWWALVAAALASSLVARELGGRALAQAMAALLVVSNPMAWIQASSAKNDVVVAMWVLMAAYWVVQALHESRCRPGRAVLIGCAAGMALLTKPTGALFVLPLLVLLGGWLLYRQRHRCVPAGVLIATILLVLNAGHFARNLTMFDSPMPGGAIQYQQRPLTTEARTPSVLLSNMSRNVALHLGTPWTGVNQRVQRVVEHLHTWIGADIDDPRTSAYQAFRVRYRQRFESTAAAPLHVGLFAAALLALPFALWRRRRVSAGCPAPDRSALWLAAAVALAALAGFVLFSLLLKWQPWHARLHTGILALAAPAGAALLLQWRAVAVPVCALVLVPLAPTALYNDARPLLGERSIFTTPRNHLLDYRVDRADTDQLVQFIREVQPRTLGIILHVDGEYALMRRLMWQMENPPLFADPAIPRERLHRPWPPSDLVISDLPHGPRLRDTSADALVYRIRRLGTYSVYGPAETARALHESGVIDELPDGMLE